MYGTGITQETYQQYQQQIINMITAAMLNNSFSLSFSNAKQGLDLNTIGDLRHFIALESQSPDAEDFGAKRNCGLNTTFSSRYACYRDKFIQYLNNNLNDNNLHDCHYDLVDDQLIFKGKIIGSIENEPIVLTSYGLGKDGFAWIHAPYQNIDEILLHVNKLIKEILAPTLIPNDHKELLIKNAAEIHWWLAHATPFQRGSAAISEWIIKAIFQYHGISISWKTLPDCEALITPSVELFKQKYGSLIDEYKILPNIHQQLSNSTTQQTFSETSSPFHHPVKPTDDNPSTADKINVKKLV